MTRKFKIGDKVKLNPNMDYSCINLSSYNRSKTSNDSDFQVSRQITELNSWLGDNRTSSGKLIKNMYCYILDNWYTFPEIYLIKAK